MEGSVLIGKRTRAKIAPIKGSDSEKKPPSLALRYGNMVILLIRAQVR
jgi:hypothetical protein